MQRQQPITTLDRQAISQALAKSLAYKNCGDQLKAALWAARLVNLLQCAEILGDLPAEYSDLFGGR